MTKKRSTRFNLRNFSLNTLINHICNKNVDESFDTELNGFTKQKSDGNELSNENANSADDHDITEDLMQLFSVVNIRIQKVSFYF